MNPGILAHVLIGAMISSTAVSGSVSLTFEQDAKSKNLKLIFKNTSEEKQAFFDVFSYVGGAMPPLNCQFAQINPDGKILKETEEFSLNTMDSYAFFAPVTMSWIYPGEQKGATFERLELADRIKQVLEKLAGAEQFNVVRFTAFIGLDEHLAKGINAQSPYYKLRDYTR